MWKADIGWDGIIAAWEHSPEWGLGKRRWAGLAYSEGKNEGGTRAQAL